MKGRTIALGDIAGRKVAALIVDGQLDDLLVEGPPDRPAPGAILRAIAGRPLKGQGGMMLDLPEGRSAFLRQTEGIAPGQALLVQVSGHAEPAKAVPVTTRLLFKSRYAILTPDAPGVNVSRAIRDEDRHAALTALGASVILPDGAGLILRSAAEAAPDDDVTADIAALADAARAVLGDAKGRQPEVLLDADDPHIVAWREWEADDVDAAPGALERHGVPEMIAALRDPAIPLPGGASLIVEPTRALVAVDVNTGPDASPAAGLKANIAAARALPRALRCRGLGGQVTVDFAPSPKKDRRQIETTLRAAFKTDPIETVLAGWTPLGHFELQRKRERLPLSETLP
jgi:Ribonuclease G/E